MNEKEHKLIRREKGGKQEIIMKREPKYTSSL